MGQIVKITAAIIIALTIFLAGWIGGNRNKNKEITKAVKQALTDTQQVQKEALKEISKKYEDQLREKDRIINQLKEIIERLLTILNKRDAISGIVASKTNSGIKLTQILHSQLEKLNSI